MEYRTDTKSGNKLSVLGFGGMRLPRDKEKSERLITQAVEGGVNYIDTAYLYPGSETTIGEILEKTGLRSKIYLATKLPHRNLKSRDDIERIFNEQKKRLKTDYFDYYLMHNFVNLAQWQGLLNAGITEWIAAKKQSGEIRQVGFSFHGQIGEFKKLIDSYDWDFCQIQYNYINTHYQAGTEGLRYAAAKGLPVIIMEPLLGGKLANPPKEAAQIFTNAKAGSTPVDWALNWLWNQPEVTVVLSGMNDYPQLDENLKLAGAAKISGFSADDEQTIEKAVAAFNKSYKIACTGCNYCMPCTKMINIPACFAAYNASYSQGRITGITMYLTGSGMGSETTYYASHCIACGACEKKCPQHLPISQYMKQVQRRLEPRLLRFIVEKIVYGK
jgi:predicted aldo/keto reductase-like oxidoreductase